MPHIKGTNAVNFRDLTDQRFGRLTVVSRTTSKKFPKGNIMAQWICRCDCGEELVVLGNNLKRGNTTSCGCLRDESVKNNKSAWRGGRYINKDGYALLYVKGTADEQYQRRKGIYELEHTIIMSRHLNRKLFNHENVHHINGDRSDNRLDNLELWSTSQPRGQRIQDKILWAKELILRYEPEWQNGLIKL